MIKRKFKNARQQSVYETARSLGASGGWIGGVLSEAFCKGKTGIKSQWPRTSMAYASWCAGKDHAAAERVQR